MLSHGLLCGYVFFFVGHGLSLSLSSPFPFSLLRLLLLVQVVVVHHRVAGRPAAGAGRGVQSAAISLRLGCSTFNIRDLNQPKPNHARPRHCRSTTPLGRQSSKVLMPRIHLIGWGMKEALIVTAAVLEIAGLFYGVFVATPCLRDRTTSIRCDGLIVADSHLTGSPDVLCLPYCVSKTGVSRWWEDKW